MNTKRNLSLAIVMLCLTTGILNAQIGVNNSAATPNPSAVLDLNTGNTLTSPNGKGLLIPNVALTGSSDNTTITSPAISLLVYVPTGSGLTPAGYYYNAGTSSAPAWIQLSSAGGGSGWLLTGNAGTTTGTNFIGTTDAQAFEIKVNNTKSGWIDYNAANANALFGYQAGNSTTGAKNTAVGYQSLLTNTTGSNNTAIGYQADVNSGTLVNATAIGNGAKAPASNSVTLGNSSAASLYLPGYNTVGSLLYMSAASGLVASLTPGTAGQVLQSNGASTAPSWLTVAVGSGWTLTGNAGTTPGTNFIGTTDAQALVFKANNTQAGWIDCAGNANAFLGYEAGFNNTSGSSNAAIGYHSLSSNNSGSNNTANGAFALLFNTGGNNNTANGWDALENNVTGVNNTANGAQALGLNASGSSNSAYGYKAGYNNTADANVFIGDSAGYANTTGTNNTFMGYKSTASAGTYTNATAIGNGATVTFSNAVEIGNSNVTFTGLNGAAYNASFALAVGTAGGNGNGAYLPIGGGPWVNTSDSTQKRNIKNIGYGLDAVMKLRPVSFDWKVNNKPDLGFIAQEVKHVLPELVGGEEGHMHLAYSQITAVLAKAVQEQQHTIDSLKTLLNKQATAQAKINTKTANEIADLKQMIRSLTTGKIDAQAKKPATNPAIIESKVATKEQGKN